MSGISPDLAEIALENVDGSVFEKFGHDFYAALEGISFIPLGGNKDGGADGYFETVSQNASAPEHFFQASVQADFRTKIKRTVKRLQEFGRSAKSLTYLTSRELGHVDKIENELSDNLGLRIRIRDRKYIISQLNTSRGCQAAFENHLSRYLTFLRAVGSAKVISKSRDVLHPEVFVFLRQELDQRSGKIKLVEAVTDSLILWALEGTDPDRKLFLTRDGIFNKIIETIPTTKVFLDSTLDPQIRALYSKQYNDGRQIRWYPDGKGCLPYETRLLVEEENIRDEALRVRVKNSFAQCCRDLDDTHSETLVEEAAILCMRAV